MNVLWVFAHPEPHSLGGSLRADGLRALRRSGHRVRSSDLYAMGWNPVVDGADFAHDGGGRLLVAAASEQADATGTLRADIRAEQGKLLWADAVVLQFPLWWEGMPAILKGWFDRVFVKGFAYGVTDAACRVRRYGDGLLCGKRAMVVVTAGAPEPGFGPRGVHGHIDELLFPLQHGTLFYTGMSVLPPFVVPGADRLTEAEYVEVAAGLRERLAALPTARPIAFRPENGGEYGTDLVLCPEVAPGRTGLAVHVAG